MKALSNLGGHVENGMCEAEFESLCYGKQVIANIERRIGIAWINMGLFNMQERQVYGTN